MKWWWKRKAEEKNIHIHTWYKQTQNTVQSLLTVSMCPCIQVSVFLFEKLWAEETVWIKSIMSNKQVCKNTNGCLDLAYWQHKYVLDWNIDVGVRYSCQEHVFFSFLFFLSGLTFLLCIWCCFENLTQCQLCRSDVFQISLEHLKHQGVVLRAEPTVFSKQSLSDVLLISNIFPGGHRVALLPEPKMPVDSFDCLSFLLLFIL